MTIRVRNRGPFEAGQASPHPKVLVAKGVGQALLLNGATPADGSHRVDVLVGGCVPLFLHSVEQVGVDTKTFCFLPVYFAVLGHPISPVASK